jgi:5-methylcytosine-specific restriction protein A
MNSLSAILSRLSSDLGVELILFDNSTDKLNPYAVRFGGLDFNKSFSLVLSRSWKTTQIRLKADSFAGEVVKYLCDQINANQVNFGAAIDANQGNFSSIILELDGRPFFGSGSKLSDNPSLVFEVETLTSESSIEYGLINEQEERVLSFAITLIASVLPIELTAFRHADEVLGYPEGAVSQVLVNRYERDPRNRKAAIAIHGKICMACGFDFQEVYGDLGDDYIVVHHVTPVSVMGEDYVVDPETDLVSICANCHAMVHRKNPPLTINELKRLLDNKI